jgi:hypothetical protein
MKIGMSGVGVFPERGNPDRPLWPSLPAPVIVVIPKRQSASKSAPFRVGPGKEALDIDDDEGSSPGIESDGRLLFLTND